MREQRWQAKSVWSPSSLEMSSLEKVRPGMRDRFLSQKMAQKEPEKKMPSTAEKATSLSWKERSLFIHFMAHCAFSLMTSMLEMAEKRQFFSFWSLMQVSMRREQVQEWTFSMAIWKPQKHLAQGICTSQQNCWAKFSSTMPSEAAKKARTYLMKCFSCWLRFCQSFWSWQRSSSSEVQKDARCFLYISQTEWYCMGKRTQREGFSLRIGSSTGQAVKGYSMVKIQNQMLTTLVKYCYIPALLISKSQTQTHQRYLHNILLRFSYKLAKIYRIEDWRGDLRSGRDLVANEGDWRLLRVEGDLNSLGILYYQLL